MPFKKGHKLGKGRPKGVENKEKKALREMLTLLVEENYDKFKNELLGLKGSVFTDRFLQLLEYCTPKLNRTDLTSGDEKINFSGISDAGLIDEFKSITKQLSKELSQQTD